MRCKINIMMAGYCSSQASFGENGNSFRVPTGTVVKRPEGFDRMISTSLIRSIYHLHVPLVTDGWFLARRPKQDLTYVQLGVRRVCNEDRMQPLASAASRAAGLYWALAVTITPGKTMVRNLNLGREAFMNHQRTTTRNINESRSTKNLGVSQCLRRN